jgi:sortase A
VERALLAVGVLALTLYAGAHVHRGLSSRIALDSFERIRDGSPRQAGEDPALPRPEAVDFSLWSSKRVADYRKSLSTHSASAVAVLRIPKIHLEVPVFSGIDELTLNRGVGLIPGTATPGEAGNIGIAGHRDGFFRGLKRIAPGDGVELVTAHHTWEYTVDSIKIVTPEDVSVLADRGTPLLTLVTCYPFYFVGNAPKRWIVQCTSTGYDSAEETASELLQSEPRKETE